MKDFVDRKLQLGTVAVVKRQGGLWVGPRSSSAEGGYSHIFLYEHKNLGSGLSRTENRFELWLLFLEIDSWKIWWLIHSEGKEECVLQTSLCCFLVRRKLPLVWKINSSILKGNVSMIFWIWDSVCGKCIRCPQKTLHVKISSSPTSVFNFSKQDMGTSFKWAHTACQSAKVTTPLNLKLWKWALQVQIMTVVYTYFTEIMHFFFVSTKSHQSSWLRSELEKIEAVLTSFWVLSTILRVHFLHVMFFVTPMFIFLLFTL